MAWSLGGIVIHPGDNQWTESIESHYALQVVLDATVETISYFGAGSERIALAFSLFESENGSTGKTTLKAAVRANANCNLTADTGSLGNYRILSMSFARQMATNHSAPVYECTCELIAS